MGLFSKGSKAKFKKIPLSESQKVADKFLTGLIDNQIDLPQREIAGLSQAEQQSIEQAQRLSATGDIGMGISDVLTKTLAGDYDPRTSPFYQGFRDEAQRLKGEGISDAFRRSQRLTGAPAGVAQRQAGDVAGRADENIMQVLGSLYEGERNKQFTAAQNAPGVFGGIANVLASAGGLERSIEQQILDAQFTEKREEVLAPYQYQAPIASNIMSQQRYQYQPGTEGSSVMQDIAGVAGIVAAPFTGGASLALTAGAGMMGGGASSVASAAGGVSTSPINFGNLFNGASAGIPTGGSTVGNLNTGMPANPYQSLYA